MACSRNSVTNKGEKSILFDTLYEIAKKDETLADKYFAQFQNETFKEEFGDWVADAALEYEERTIDQRKVDDNGEPKLIWDNKLGKYYYITKNGIKNVYNPGATSLKKIFSNEYSRNVTKILALNFVKGRIGENFNTLDLSERQGTLRQSIEATIKRKINDFRSTPDIEFQFRADQLEKSLEVINEWVTSVENFFTEVKLVYKETNDQEDQLEEEESERGQTFGKSSFEKSTKDNVSSNVKLRLSLLTSEKLDPVFNEPTFIDFDEVYSTLLNSLTGNIAINKDGKLQDLFEIYKTQILSLSAKKPYLADLHQLLSRADITDNIKAEFVQAFNLDKNNFIGTIYKITPIKDEDGVVTYKTTSTVQNLSDVGAKSKFVKSNWQYNFNQVFLSDKGEFNDASKTAISKKATAYNKFYNGFKKKLKNKDYSTEESLEAPINGVVQVLKGLGVETTKDGFSHYLDGLSPLNLDVVDKLTNLNKLVDSINYFFTAASKNEINSADKNPLDTQKEFAKLAEAEAFFMNQGSDASIYTVGKTKWVYSYPSYLSNKLKQWKKDRNSLLTHYNASEYNKRSHYMEYLLALDGEFVNAEEVSQQRIEDFELNVFNSLQGEGNAVDNKQISKNDTFADIYNKVLGFRKGAKSYVNSPTPADKATQYQFTVPKELMINSNAVYKDGDVQFNEKAKEILFNYVLGEHERMKQVQREINIAEQTGDKSKLVQHYHLGNQNGLKFQMFPSLNFENFNDITEGYSLYDENGAVLTDVSLEIEEIKSEILFKIEKTVSKDIQTLFTQLRTTGIIELNSNGVYTNKGLDSEIWESYKGAQTAMKIAADIYINSLISQVEYSKMFSGDVAYYKDAVDYKKRIPATYTDGLQLYLRPGEERFNAAVISSVYLSDPDLDKLKEILPEEVWSSYDNNNINSADAQAWITPKRWKFLRERLGKFQEADQVVFDKMMGVNKEVFTAEELKRAAQPLKGVYFEINEGRPVFLKYSQAVLLPQVIKGTALETLYDKMVESKIDEVITEDGVKVGAFQPQTAHNIDGSFNPDVVLTPMSLNNSGWKLQQDLPVKTDKSTDVGSQIQKIIFSGLSFNPDKDFLIGNKELKGSDLIDRLNNIVENLSDAGFANLEREFGIGADGKITNVSRLNQALVKELKSRGSSNNVIEALESGMSPFGIPGSQEQIQNVFASMVTKRVVKIQTNGGSFIQMSNFGFNKTEAEENGVMWTPWSKNTPQTYEYLRDAEGNIVKSKSGTPVIRPAGILLTGSFIQKHIPNYREMSPEQLFGKYNAETNNYEGGAIDQRILNNIIGYRIPNQGLASNDALQVVGILPEAAGDTVVAYTGITTKTGSDFDIDKMYLMMPSFLPKRRNAAKIRNYIFQRLKGKNIEATIDNITSIVDQLDPEDEIVKFDAKRLAKIILSKDNVEVLKFEVDNFVEAVLKSKSPLAEFIKESIPTYNKVDKLEYIEPIEDLANASVEQLQNSLIEAYKGIITHPDVIKSVLTPIDFDFLEDDIKSLFPVQEPRDLQTFNIIDEVNLKFEFMAGKAGVGQTANALVDHVRGQMADLRLNKMSLGWGNEKGGETKFDEEYSEKLTNEDYNYYISQLGPKAGKLRNVKIADSLSALMNAYVDIAKDPFITRGNWTTQTANAGFMLLRAGVHPVRVNALLAQPIIKEFSDYVSNSESIIINNTGDLIEKFIKTKIIEELKNSGETVEINGIVKNKAVVYASAPTLNPYSISTQFGLKNAKDEQVLDLVADLERTVEKYYEENYYDVTQTPLKTLRDNVNGEPDILDQIAILRTFSGYVQTSKQLVNSINASKADVNGYGKNVTNLLVNYNLVNDLLNVKDHEGNLVGFDTKLTRGGNHTILGTYIKNSIGKIKEIMQANPLNFLAANEGIFNSFNDISRAIYGENLKNDRLADKVNRAFYSHVMSGFPALQMSKEEKQDLIDNLPAEIDAAKKGSDNLLLKELDLKAGDGGRTFVVMSNRKKSPSLQTDITNAWSDLREDNPELAEKLIQYSYLTSGFQMNVNQFYTYIPYEWFAENKINDYINQVAIDYNKSNIIDDGFVFNFFRHNMDDSQVVGRVFDNQIIKYKNNIHGFVLKGDPLASDVDKRFVKKDFEVERGDGEVTTITGLFELEGFDENLNPVYIRKLPLGTSDSKGNKIYEYSFGVDIVPTIINTNKVSGLTEAGRNNVREDIIHGRDTQIVQLDNPSISEDSLTDFTVVNEITNTDTIKVNLFEIESPELEVTGMTAQEIANADNAEELIIKQKELKKESDVLDNLIKCLWKK